MTSALSPTLKLFLTESKYLLGQQSIASSIPRDEYNFIYPHTLNLKGTIIDRTGVNKLTNKYIAK